MGLDQCFKVIDTIPENLNINSEEVSRMSKTIHDLRGHWQMQLFLEKVYRERGGKGDFSCYNLQLTRENLVNLRNAIQNFELPKYQLYKNTYHSEEEYAQMSYDHVKMFRNLEKNQYYEDLELIEKCIKLVDEGKIVYYWSWW